MASKSKVSIVSSEQPSNGNSGSGIVGGGSNSGTNVVRVSGKLSSKAGLLFMKF